MYDEPRLSDEEWDLIVELLECERSELPVEIHHTRNASVREGLAAPGGCGAETARSAAADGDGGVATRATVVGRAFPSADRWTE